MGLDFLAQLYAEAIIEGKRNIDSIPKAIVESVQKILDNQNK